MNNRDQSNIEKLNFDLTQFKERKGKNDKNINQMEERYEKKSITLTGNDYKKLEKDFDINSFVKKYHIRFLLEFTLKHNCLIIIFLKKQKRKKTNEKDCSNHFYKPVEDRIHNKGDGKGKYIKYICCYCEKRYRKYLQKNRTKVNLVN